MSNTASPLSIPKLLLTFLNRDIHIELSYRFAFISSLAGVFFRVILFYFLSELIGDNVDPLLATYDSDYFAFVLIGIAFGSYFGVGLTGFARALRQAQITGTLEAMIMTPTPVSLLIIGSAAWNYTFTTFRVVIYILTGVLFLGLKLSQANYLAALLSLVLAIIAFASIGIITASVIMVIKRGDPITTLISNITTPPSS